MYVLFTSWPLLVFDNFFFGEKNNQAVTTMFRSISSRSASRRFSTLASKNKKIYQDDIDFMEAQQHDIENEHDHRTLHWIPELQQQ
jgi:hypothetical protein